MHAQEERFTTPLSGFKGASLEITCSVETQYARYLGTVLGHRSMILYRYSNGKLYTDIIAYDLSFRFRDSSSRDPIHARHAHATSRER